MANIFSSQIIKDTTEQVIIKLTGVFDGTGQEANTSRIAANTISGALATNGFLVANTQGGAANTALPFYGLTLKRMWTAVFAPAGDVQLNWQATTPVPLLVFSNDTNFNENGNSVSLPNLAKGTAGCLGDIGIVTRGFAANNSYTIILELRKDNAMYNRGQFADPAAFNFGGAPGFGPRP